MAWRSLLVATMAVVVVSLQIGLPWLSCYLVDDSKLIAMIQGDLLDPRGFWKRRFSFDRFLNPTSEQLFYRHEVFSAAVCQDELVVIINPNKQSSTTARINLHTGRVTSSPTPEDVVSVASDGKSLHWIRSDSNWGDVILWKGQSVRFGWVGADNADPVDRFSYQMMELDAGRWRPTLRFVLVPSNARNVMFDVDRATGTLCGIAYSESDDRLWFHHDLQLRSLQEHAQALSRYRMIEADAANDTRNDLDSMGWRSMPPTEWASSWDICWVERGVVSKLSENRYPSKREPPGRVWTQFFEDGRIEHQVIPIRIRESLAGYDPTIHAVKSADGSIYLVCRSTFDQRWTVLRCDNGHFRTVIDQRSPLLGLTCLDAALFALLALMIPMIVLWWSSTFIQGRSQHLNGIGDQLAIASISRRGLARAIDVAIWGVPLLFAFVLHPEVVEWWSDVMRSWTDFRLRAIDACSQHTWKSLIGLRSDLFSVLQSQFPLPVLRPLLFVAVGIVVGQIVWQCVSGQTLGKWLLGIKVVRSDTRRCSWGRCCLREALFFVDTLLLLSWVPGVVSMLLSSKSQRIGDWVTDTIVIDSRSPK